MGERMPLADIVARHARASPDQCALHFEGEDISYSQLWQRIQRATGVLQKRGVQQGDRVAYMGLNGPAMLVLLFALARLGAILLPLNYRLALAELQAILDHSEASLIVTDDHHAAVAAVMTLSGGLKPIAIADLHADVADVMVSELAEPVDLAELDELPVLLVYTSGTTGKPKGALHTQAGLVWNCVISTHAHDLNSADHVLTVLPMFHVGGLCIQTLPALHAGARVTLHRRFEAGAWLHDVQQRRPTISLMVPATLRAVLEHADFERTDLSSLKLLNAGSSLVPVAMIVALHARGVPVCQVYGATETGPVSIYLRREDAMRFPGSAGEAGLHVDVRLVDKRGKDVATNEVGEICIRAPNVMSGYWSDADNPAFQNGWFHSGDLAHRDENGFYWVVGRSKDMIISGGENIYPAELESVLAECPDIVEAAVVGRDDARWGEVAVAVVVKKPDASLSADDVLKLFDGRLARFKHPRQVVFQNALPKTALGKVQKAELKASLG
jgi:fatty-acyl-CoA synthase